MTILAVLTAVAAFLAPWVTALVNRPSWSSQTKQLVAGAIAGVLGLIAAVATGAIEGIPENWTTSLAAVIVAIGTVIPLAQGFYSAFKTPAKALEAATSASDPAAVYVEADVQGDKLPRRAYEGELEKCTGGLLDTASITE